MAKKIPPRQHPSEFLDGQISMACAIPTSGIRRDDIALELGVDYQGELLISSKGNYIYHCPCGSDVIGSVSDLSLTKPYIQCSSSLIGKCDLILNVGPIAGQLGVMRVEWIYDKRKNNNS